MGLRLAGIDGAEAHTREELTGCLDGINPDIGIVIVTSGLASLYPDVVKTFHARSFPLLITLDTP
jgi:vacuolar-type H+-ATPase subunit F/Vma7